MQRCDPRRTTPRISWHDRNPFWAKLTRTPRHRGSRPLTVMTLYGPWEGTNNGHPTMILTGMTHGDYQPALHPPPSDLEKFSPLLANHHHQSTSMAFPAAPSMGHEEAQTLATTTTHSLL